MPTDRTNLEVLYEDNHLLAVNKPAMLPTMGVSADMPSLLTVARDYVRVKHDKPGNVYLGIVSRLDAPVTGVVLMAKTSKAAARLSQAFRTRAVRKVYLAVVEGTPAVKEAVLVHYLRKDERHRKVHCTHEACPDARLARLTYRQVESRGNVSLLEVQPETGRKHQIRVQLAKVGRPILGDRKYGSLTPFGQGIALHALRLEVEHPVRHEPLTIAAPLPGTWRRDSRVNSLLSDH